MSSGRPGQVLCRAAQQKFKFKLLKQTRLKGVKGRSGIGWLEPRRALLLEGRVEACSLAIPGQKGADVSALAMCSSVPGIQKSH